MKNIATFIKYQRQKSKMTQEELANNSGVGLRFIRDLEQGKETLQLDKVNQVLSLFGYSLSPEKKTIDAYDISMNYFNLGIKIELKNKLIKYGIFIEDIKDEEQQIMGWKFVPNNNAIAFKNKPNNMLTEIIYYKDILTINLQ